MKKTYLSGVEFLKVKEEIKKLKKLMRESDDPFITLAYNVELRELYQKLRGC